MSKNLIERLEKIKQLLPADFFNGVHPSRWRNYLKAIDEAIAALSPVLPEDVQRCCNHLRATADDLGAKIYADYADLIERLARREAWLAAQYDQVDDLQQRIEELDAELKRTNIAYDLAREERDTAEQRIEELENGI